MTGKMRCAIYARVSTEDRGQDTENQLFQLREYCERTGMENVGEYIDHITAKNANRPQFQQLFRDAAHRKFDIVVFWSLDRFSREGVLATLNQLQNLTAAGVGYRSYTEQYLDSCGIFKDAVLSILATVAKQERIRISERTKAGVDRARRQGKHCGRPKRVFAIGKAQQLRAEGMSWRAIAERLKVPFATVRRAVALQPQ